MKPHLSTSDFSQATNFLYFVYLWFLYNIFWMYSFPSTYYSQTVCHNHPILTYCYFFLLTTKQTKQTKNRDNSKTTQKNETSLNRICVGQSPWKLCLAWSVVEIPSATLLEKTHFPSPSRWYWQTTSFLGVGLDAHFHSLCAGILPGLSLCGLVLSVIVSMSLYVHLFCCVWKMPLV